MPEPTTADDLVNLFSRDTTEEGSTAQLDLTPAEIEELRYPGSTETGRVSSADHERPRSPRAFTDGLLTEIRDALLQQTTILRFLAASEERRNFPFVWVPDGTPDDQGQPFAHYRDAQAQREAAARAAEIALLAD